MTEEGRGEIELIYLTLEDALELYGLIVGATAAEAAKHLRNRDRLESALARPATYAHYEDADLALQAAVLAHGIAQSQLFIDRNKRTRRSRCSPSWRSMDSKVKATDPELARWILGFSARATPEDITKLLRPGLFDVE
ncbi:MAG: Fic family protein [Solirubrobacteraceae bacterium]|jgi:hypothetical protein